MSGAEIAAEVAAGIAEASAEVGSGTPLTGTIIRRGPDNQKVHPPVKGSDTPYACTVLFGEFSAMDRMGSEITAQHVKVIVSPDAETDPRNGDRLVIQGVTYHVEQVDAVKPGGTVLMWEVVAKRA